MATLTDTPPLTKAAAPVPANDAGDTPKPKAKKKASPKKKVKAKAKPEEETPPRTGTDG